MPDLGGNAFHYPGDSDLTGVRIKPPPLDPHRFHEERKEAKKKVTIDDPPEDPKTARPTSRRRESRDKSVTKYETLRKLTGQPDETAGHHREKEKRGRSRNPVYLR